LGKSRFICIIGYLFLTSNNSIYIPVTYGFIKKTALFSLTGGFYEIRIRTMKANIPKIKSELKRRGWKHKDLAIRLKPKVTRQAVEYYLKNPGTLSFRTISRIAVSLEMDPKDLLIS